MSLLNKVLGHRIREAAQEAVSRVPVSIGANGFDLSTNSRMEVNELTSFAVAAYHAGIEMIAKQFAIMPFRYMSKNAAKGVYEEREGDILHYLLTVRPQANMSAYMWRYMLAKRTVHNGEAFVYPRFVGDQLSELVLCSDHSASYDYMNHRYNITDTVNGIYANGLEENEVLHFIWNSPDGYTGDAAWWLAKTVLDIAATADKETQKRFESGGNVKGIVSNNVQVGGAGSIGNYRTSTLEDVAKEIDRQFRNGSNIAAVGGDARFSQISQSSADMQMNEQQKRITIEIARHLGLQPYILGVESSGTQYNTPEVAKKAFLTETLEPFMQMVENEFQGKMTSRSKCHYYIFKFDRDEVFALDLKSKADYYEKMLQIGAMTVNDIRRKENMPVVENGDEILVSANLMTIEALKAKGETAAPTETQRELQRDAKGRFMKRDNNTNT